MQVQRWLGHQAPAFTLETYVHLLDNYLADPLDDPVGVSKGSARHPEPVQDATGRPSRVLA